MDAVSRTIDTPDSVPGGHVQWGMRFSTRLNSCYVLSSYKMISISSNAIIKRENSSKLTASVHEADCNSFGR
jgi:hypothetical protein